MSRRGESDPLDDRIRSRLSSRESRKILRKLTEPNNHLVDFSSNDYLGLASHPELRRRFIDRLTLSSRRSLPLSADPPFTSYPSSSSFTNTNVLGATGSRLLDGNTRAHIELETRLEAFFDSPKGGALLFNSGYDANVGIFSCLPQNGDYVVYDSLIHASVHDGMRASRVPESARLSFRHNSAKDLEYVLDQISEKDERIRNGKVCVFVAVEALYSMDGDLAPLDTIVELVERRLPLRNGYIIVDEAHSTGLYGPSGRGLVAHLGLENHFFIRLHTFGKALASNGGAFSGNHEHFCIFLFTNQTLCVRVRCCSDDTSNSKLSHQLRTIAHLHNGTGEL